jgi:hypothetical protein
MMLLREFTVNDLVDPCFINIIERSPNHYQLQIKTNHNCSKLEDYAKSNDLAMSEDKEYVFIYKP